ncbi:MAG: DUF4032 domain-containing protein [Ignavibacteria bacterium]|jgi:hypothetical protein
MTKENLVFNIYQPYREELKNLPWHKPLSEWVENDFVFIKNVRKGRSKHLVEFIKTQNYSFAVKQTTPVNAYFEVDTFARLLKRGIHTLTPAGYVIYRDENNPAVNGIEDDLAFVVTILKDKSVPHSILFKWDFKEENRKILYKAVARLLAQLHVLNIYWGDASLTNNLIKFTKVLNERGNTITEVKAFLTDAESVKILPEISKDLLKEDLKDFFNSLRFFNEEYIKQGSDREHISLKEDKKYFLKKYNEHYDLLKRIKVFEEETGIIVRETFFEITDINFLEAIQKQIDEHKWYLSEHANEEVSMEVSAKDWIDKIYKPIIDEFEKSGILDLFSDINSVSLYVQIMTHKYYLSQKKGKDIGTKKAIQDYVKKFSNKRKTKSIVAQLLENIAKIFPSNYRF